MADDIDISGMPDPGTIGLSPEKEVDPTVGMPDPHALYQQHHGYPAASDEDVTEFMRNPDATPDVRKARSAREGASMLTGLPRAAATGAMAVPAAVGAVSGQLQGALGAALDPDHAGSYLEQGRDIGRKRAEKIYKLADYVPATQAGAELSDSLMGIPGQIGSAVNQGVVKPVLGENAARAVGDVAQDVATDLPILGLPGAVRGVAKGARASARAVKAATADVAPAEGTTYDAAGNAETPSQVKTPPVGKQVTGESLRAAPNPIPPPEGTQAHARQAAAAPTPPPATGHAPLLEDGANAFTLAREAEARRRMAEDNIAPEPYAEPFAGRQAEHEGAVAMRNAQRGSVRLFNSPKEEGPKETPAPEEQSERKQHLDALDTLSGGALPSRRASALTGDYNATGNDWQMKEVGNAPMQQQIASENAALHTAVDNVHKSIGSEFEDSVDPQVMGDRGRVTRGAIQGIEKHFDDATDGIYEAAREQNKGRPIAELKRVKAYLDDDSNFANDAEIGLQRAGKQRLERLWSTGDPDKGVPPGSVNAAEKFREFLNEKGKNPAAMGVANELKGHTDMDVAEHGGPGLFEMARALRRHKYQMLEEPTGIKKLLTPGDSQGINHAIPEHKVMDYIADLPREQHEHVLNVLRAGAHLDPELAEHSAAAIREIQAHTLSRLHDAATDDGGKWNARAFYSAASRYGRNAEATFADRPDVLKNLKTINDAGNTLHMDKHYPGASAQGERTGAAGHALEVGGALASGMAHHVPVLGRPLGRIIEAGVEKATGKLSETSRDKEVMTRLVDRNGKQRGSVQVMRDSPASRVKDEFEKAHPEDAPVGYLGKRVGKSTAEIYTDPGDPSTVHLEKLAADAPGSGQGTAALQHITQLADKHGARVTLDAVPQMKGLSRERLKAYYARHGFESDGNTENSMTREPNKESAIRAAQFSKQRGAVGDLSKPSANPGGEAQTKLPAFKRWFGKSKITQPFDSDDKPLVVYHGTTHDFSKFSAAGVNPESDHGKGFYFSNHPEDVEHNYAGKGPDLTQRIELEAERLENSGVPRDKALARAHAKLMTHGGTTVPAYLRIENPAVIGDGAHGEGTELTHELEYENPNDPESDIKGEKGTLPKFIHALRSVSEAAGAGDRDMQGLNEVLNDVTERAMDGSIPLNEVIKKIHDSGALIDISDSKGNSLGHELVRRALQKMGYDGIIDHDVNKKFGTEKEGNYRTGGMKGMNPDTVHYIAFKPHQVKSAIGNSGAFSRKNADITAKNDGSQQSGVLA